MNKAIIFSSIMVVFASTFVLLFCSCSKVQTVTEEKEITLPPKEEKSSVGEEEFKKAGEAKIEKLKELEIAKKKVDYLEKQKISSTFEPKDTFSEEAYKLYEKAMGTSEYPGLFIYSGTSDPEGIRFLEEAIEFNPHYHAAHYMLGVSYKKIEDYEKAKKCFLRCIELKPKYQDAYTSLASLYEDTKHYDDALKFYLKALDVDPSTISLYISIGDIYLKKNSFSKAEESYKRTFQHDDIYPYACEHLAYLYLKKGDLKASWNYLKKSYPYLVSEKIGDRFSLYSNYLEKNNFYAYASVGRIYYYSLQYEKAIEYLEKAIKLKPSEFDQFYELGMAYNYTGNMQKVRIYLEKAVTINPKHYDANLQLGIQYDISPGAVEFYQTTYKVKPNYNRAIKLFLRAKGINPKNAEPYYYLGQTYYHQKLYYAAVKETKEALNIKEDYPTLTQLGDIYFAMSEHEDALVAYKKSLAKADSPWARYDIAKTLFELKKYNKEIVFLCESLEKHKDDLRLKHCLAEAYKYKKDYETAIRKYKDILESDPINFSAHFEIASCYYDQQNWIEAKNWWEKAAGINPKSSASLYNIGLAYFEMKAYALAKTYFKKALDINPDDNKAKGFITICQVEIDRKNFPEKLKKISHRNDNVGILARFFLFTFEYNNANNLWIEGVGETKYEDGENIVSSKIFEAQGYFEKCKADLMKIGSASGKIQDILDSFLFAVEQRVKGIEQHSGGFYKKRGEYKGEYERGRAKIKLADASFVDGLKILLNEIINYKSQFSKIAEDQLKSSIEYYEKKK